MLRKSVLFVVMAAVGPMLAWFGVTQVGDWGGAAGSYGNGRGYFPDAVTPVSGQTLPDLPVVTGRIHVDQFGYRPEMAKVAVISDPQRGYNDSESYHPGSELEVRRRDDGVIVFTGTPELWAGGEVHEVSGDRGWWFDFSELQVAGEYFVFDPESGKRSPLFRIGADVYAEVLRAALRAFYYQRLDTATQEPYAESPWVDTPAFPQDAVARAVDRPGDRQAIRDLRGGWMDAGDANKYPTFLGEVIHPLLHAWSRHPERFTDDLGIPESGNGLPDLLDEVAFALDWLIRMQEPDGGVFIKMGVTNHNEVWPLSSDRRPRFYGPTCSSSTLWSASIFAHAARVYAAFSHWRHFADVLKFRAIKAWDWYETNPRSEICDSGAIKAGNADKSLDAQDRKEAFAAAHLWLLTGEPGFQVRMEQRLEATLQLGGGLWSPYEATVAEVLLEYAAHPDSSAELRERIRGQLRATGKSDHFAPVPEADLYRAWMLPSAYHWGSNRVRAEYGVGAVHAADLPGKSPEERIRLRQRAADLLHSFHGVNPNGIVYLSNMEHAGAERSVSRIYHTRFPYDSPLSSNPAPGFVVGGPNARFRKDHPAPAGPLDWVRSQPPAKAFAESNAPWPARSWELTEPSLSYQAAYVRLLIEFVGPAP